jgi:urea transport system permease protein
LRETNIHEKRLGAAKDLVNNMSEELLPIIQLAIQTEDNEEIRSLLFLARGIVDIESDDEAVRLKALDVFEDQLAPEVIGILNRLLVVADDGSFAEESDAVRNKAARILKEANHQITFYKFVENLFFGISLGSVLLLAAVGLAITFGVMGVINMAHGEMIMLGAYTTYVVQQLMPDSIGTSLLISIPLAFLVSGLVGVVIERSVIRHLYGRPLETLLATFGISLILQQAVRSIFSPLNRQVESPDWMSGFLEINGALSLTYNRLYIIIFSLLVLAALAFLLKKTFIGLQMRAVTQNRAMASSMGIRSGWVDALTFGLGSGIAGIAGVALSQLTNVGPNLGQAYIVDSFMVVVFGGVGNIMGTFFAAMSLGIANKFLEPWAGAVMAKILVLIFIILFIQKRPRGMFALKGRSVEG